MRDEDLFSASRMRRDLARGVVNRDAFRRALDDVPSLDQDAWLNLVFDLTEIPDDDPGLPNGCVCYLPCPVPTLLEVATLSGVSARDVFVDVGAGVGRATALMNVLTGAGCVGIEIQPHLVRMAEALTRRLRLDRCPTLEGDATELTGLMVTGTVFLLYCPFGGDRLERVLDELEALAQTRTIRVCAVDLPLRPRDWLVPIASSPELDVYRSSTPAFR